MCAKVIVHRQHARDSLLRGIDLIADLIAPTLGPRGRHVVIQRHEAPPLVTNDGVSIARSLERLKDPLTNQGVQLLRETASTAEDLVGDGTTTAVVLARALVRESFRSLAHGAAPDELCEEIDDATAAACEWVQSQGRPVGGKAELARVATVASRDARIGRLVADALDRVGSDGVVHIDDDRAYGIQLTFNEGMRFQNGLLAPGLATDQRRAETVFQHAYVLAANERIWEVRQLVPVLSHIVRERAPLLIVADEVSGDALTLLVLNVRKRRLPVIAVKAPAFGPDRTDALADIAVFTGGDVLGPGFGTPVVSTRLDQLGRAERVIATRHETAILGGQGARATIAARMRQAAAELSRLESDYEREKRRLRLARLGGAVATIRVGLDTQAEQEETRHRIRDAVQAGRAALTDGIVPGGGATLLRAADAIRMKQPLEKSGGWAVVRAALEAPLRQLAANADIEPSLAVACVRSSPAGHGIDMETGTPTDLLTAGIFDATKVVCSTLEIAASIARTCLRAEAIVANQPTAPPRRRGHAHDSHHHQHHDHHEHRHPVHDGTATEEAAAAQ